MRSDHVKHFALSFMLTGFFLILVAWVWWWVYVAPFMSLSFRIYKELRDRATTGFDWTDILADVMGIAFAMALFAIGSL